MPIYEYRCTECGKDFDGHPGTMNVAEQMEGSLGPVGL